MTFEHSNYLGLIIWTIHGIHLSISIRLIIHTTRNFRRKWYRKHSLIVRTIRIIFIIFLRYNKAVFFKYESTEKSIIRIVPQQQYITILQVPGKHLSQKAEAFRGIHRTTESWLPSKYCAARVIYRSRTEQYSNIGKLTFRTTRNSRWHSQNSILFVHWGYIYTYV